jgi:hypothetical protein
MWHLDYVKLDNSSSELSIQDLAFTEIPNYLIQPYTSMPIRHLQAAGIALLVDTLDLSLRNHSAITAMNFEQDPIIISTANSSNLPITSTTLNPGFTSDNSVDIQSSRQISKAFRDFSTGAENFNNLATYLLETLSADTRICLNLSYQFDADNQDNSYANGALQQNDFVYRTTCFDEYMAYDDGSAEVSVEGQSGTTLLQKYEAFVADKLVGIRIRIPRGLGGLGNQDLRLVVYTGDTIPTDLIYMQDFPIRYVEDFNRDSLQGYTTYLFDEAPILSPGNFYVGWEQQPASRSIGVGFDRNNQPENVQWFDAGNGWRRLTGSTRGAIMVRPLLAGFDDFQTSTQTPEEEISLVDVFPNPTDGTLHLRPRPGYDLYSLSFRLFAPTGALIQQQSGQNRLELGDLPAGIYFLEITDGKVRSHHKIMRR